VERRSRATPKEQAALDRAFEEENLLLVYQPIHDMRTGDVIAAEALVRQRRENGEVREASIITKAAEDGPDLFLFDSVTMRMALADAAAWQKRFDVRVNVNLSPREFQEGDPIERVTNLISKSGIDTRLINLEITETSYIKRPKETMHVLEHLKGLGIQLWLDDFGTGHSTVEHLLYFPIDGIKVPATFVKDLPKKATSAAITRALIDLAHELEVRVIAEGMEREEQRDFLREAGCDYVQGFLFSKPMTAAAFSDFLATRSSPASLPRDSKNRDAARDPRERSS
jgi:EAL domain-containing protein (putative c-di-GMP-specific phosphodiesterase class I)